MHVTSEAVFFLVFWVGPSPQIPHTPARGCLPNSTTLVFLMLSIGCSTTCSHTAVQPTGRIFPPLFGTRSRPGDAMASWTAPAERAQRQQLHQHAQARPTTDEEGGGHVGHVISLICFSIYTCDRLYNVQGVCFAYGQVVPKARPENYAQCCSCCLHWFEGD